MTHFIYFAAANFMILSLVRMTEWVKVEYLELEDYSSNSLCCSAGLRVLAKLPS